MDHKILVVDDERIVCRAIKKELEREGYNVEWTQSGMEGVEMVRANGFRVAFVDLVLPDTDGVEVCREIKRENSNLKVFLMSGYGSALEAKTEEFVSAGGCQRVIKKPFDDGEFTRLAKDVFEKRADR